MNAQGIEGHSPSRNVFWVWLLLITVLGAGLRLHQLDEASLWVDEIFTIRSSQRQLETFTNKSLGYLPTSIALSLAGVPPEARHLSKSASWQAAGITHTRARAASCLIGILSLPLLMWAARAWIGGRNALLAGLLLALAPWHIQWSQEARFYSQQFLFYNLAFIWYFVGTERRSLPYIAGAIACAILAFLSQPPALMIAGIFGLDWLIARLRGRPVALGAFGWVFAILGLGFCVGVTVWDQMNHAGPSDFTQKALRDPIMIVAKALFRIDPAILVVAALGAPWLVRVRSRLGIYLAMGAVLPIAVIGTMGIGLWVAQRYSFVCLWAWLVLAAITLNALFRQLAPTFGRFTAAAPIALVVASMLLWNTLGQMNSRGLRPRWSEAFALITQKRDASDRIYANPLPGRYYLQDPEVIPLPATAEGFETGDRTTWAVLNLTDPRRSPYRDFVKEARLEAVFPMRGVGTKHSLWVYRVRSD